MTTISAPRPRSGTAGRSAPRWVRRAVGGMSLAGGASHVAFATVAPGIYETFADGAIAVFAWMLRRTGTA